jgi:general secretion pathway protein F
LVYPALLTIVSTAIIVFLLTYAMPKITKTFTDSGQALPMLTALLLQFSSGLKKYGIYILGLVFLGVLGFKRSLKSDQFRFRVHLFLLKIPILKSAITIINAARFARTFGILFAAGVPVAQAMQTANSIITLLPMKAAIKEAIEHVTEGVSIHQALYQTGFFTKMSTQLIASGETSGKLEIMLEKTAAYQEQQVLRWITTILSLFEPIMILFMGIVVLFIVLAILLPIFQMNDFFA